MPSNRLTRATTSKQQQGEQQQESSMQRATRASANKLDVAAKTLAPEQNMADGQVSKDDPVNINFDDFIEDDNEMDANPGSPTTSAVTGTTRPSEAWQSRGQSSRPPSEIGGTFLNLTSPESDSPSGNKSNRLADMYLPTSGPGSPTQSVARTTAKPQPPFQAPREIGDSQAPDPLLGMLEGISEFGTPRKRSPLRLGTRVDDPSGSEYEDSAEKKKKTQAKGQKSQSKSQPKARTNARAKAQPRTQTKKNHGDEDDAQNKKAVANSTAKRQTAESAQQALASAGTVQRVDVKKSTFSLLHFDPDHHGKEVKSATMTNSVSKDSSHTYEPLAQISSSILEEEMEAIRPGPPPPRKKQKPKAPAAILAQGTSRQTGKDENQHQVTPYEDNVDDIYDNIPGEIQPPVPKRSLPKRNTQRPKCMPAIDSDIKTPPIGSRRIPLGPLNKNQRKSNSVRKMDYSKKIEQTSGSQAVPPKSASQGSNPSGRVLGDPRASPIGEGIEPLCPPTPSKLQSQTAHTGENIEGAEPLQSVAKGIAPRPDLRPDAQSQILRSLSTSPPTERNGLSPAVPTKRKATAPDSLSSKKAKKEVAEVEDSQKTIQPRPPKGSMRVYDDSSDETRSSQDGRGRPADPPSAANLLPRATSEKSVRTFISGDGSPALVDLTLRSSVEAETLPKDQTLNGDGARVGDTKLSQSKHLSATIPPVNLRTVFEQEARRETRGEPEVHSSTASRDTLFRKDPQIENIQPLQASGSQTSSGNNLPRQQRFGSKVGISSNKGTLLRKSSAQPKQPAAPPKEYSHNLSYKAPNKSPLKSTPKAAPRMSAAVILQRPSQAPRASDAFRRQMLEELDHMGSHGTKHEALEADSKVQQEPDAAVAPIPEPSSHPLRSVIDSITEATIDYMNEKEETINHVVEEYRANATTFIGRVGRLRKLEHEALVENVNAQRGVYRKIWEAGSHHCDELGKKCGVVADNFENKRKADDNLVRWVSQMHQKLQDKLAELNDGMEDDGEDDGLENKERNGEEEEDYHVEENADADEEDDWEDDESGGNDGVSDD